MDFLECGFYLRSKSFGYDREIALGDVLVRISYLW
jgi:hypothetical protein